MHKKKIVKNILAIVMSVLTAFMSLPLSAMAAVTDTGLAQASSDTVVKLTLGNLLEYESNINWTTHMMYADGKMAYCVNPKLSAPSGTFGSSNLTEVTSSNSKYQLLLKALYYGYGGDGFEKSISAFGNKSMKSYMQSKKTEHWLGASGTDLYYLLTHRVLAYIYGDSDWSYALNIDWINTVKEITEVLKNAPSVSTTDKMYILDAKNGTQQVIVFKEVPQVGSLEITKDSSNHSLTDNNTDCYSLKGTVFTVTNTETKKQYTLTTNTKVNDSSATVKYKGTLSNFPIGTYTIKEKQAGKGYALSTETTKVTITGNNTSKVTIKNEPQNDPIAIVVKKTDSSGKTLSGAEFTIKFYKGYFTEAEIKSGKADSNFKRYWTIKTDTDGYARLANEYLVDSNNDFYYEDDKVTLPLGTITIQETKAPDGYIKDDTLYVRQITANGSAESVFTYNAPTVINEHKKGTLEIIKTSEDDIVTGIKFNIYTNDDKLVGTYTTDSNGYITKELDIGTYKVKEVTSGKYNPQPIQTVVVEENKTATVSFSNTLKNGWLEIYKTATDVVNADGTTTAGKVDGIDFEIYDSKDNLIGTYTTDENGRIAKDTIGELKPAIYRVHEIVPAGYIPQKDQTITISPNEVRTVHFNNTANGGYVKLIKESDYYDCDIFTLKIEGISNNYKGTVTIDTYEPVEVGLPVGKYKVTEILTDKQKNTWETIEPQEFVVNLQQITEVTLKNHEKLGSVKVIKSASDNIVEGIKFSLYGLSDMGAEVKYRYATTDSNGMAIFENIPVGTYTLEEISTHTKYNVTSSIDMEAVPVKWNEVTEVKVLNDEKSTPVEIYKTTDDGGFLAGFEFEITGTNSAGKYVEYKKLITDKNGLIKKDLQPGKYTITEVNIPNKYITPASQTIIIEPTASNSPQPVQVYFENKLKRGGLKVVKTAYDDNIENISFSLTSVTDGTVYYASTDENGIAAFYEVADNSTYEVSSYYLPAGEYLLREENAGEQYVNIGEIPVTIKYNKTVELAVNNTPKDGYIEIIKTSQTGIVDGFDFNIKGTTWDNKEIDENVTTSNGGKIAEKLPTGTYTITEINVPSWHEVPQPVVINVTPYDTADEPIQIEVYNKLKTGNGELTKTSEDGIVEGLKFRLYGTADCGLAVDITKTTDENGRLIFDNVYIGKYTLEEIETPVRYNTLKPVTVEIKENETIKVTANNTLKVAPVKIIKTSEYGVVENIEFRLVNEAIGYDETLKTNSDGIISMALKPGTYQVTELNVPNYAIPQAIKTLVVNPYTSDEDIATVQFDNLLKKGKLKVVKTADDGVIENVEFSIWGVSDSGEIIEKSAKTNAKGEAKFTDLPIGNYMLSEVRQADRYITVIDTDFNINWNETTTILVHNKLKIGEIGTKAKDKATDCGYAYVNEKTTLIDTVSYKDLGSNTEYTIKGVLMDKETGQQLLINGNPVTATKTFTTENGTGEIDVEFDFDSTPLRGKSVVVFEQLYYGSVELASHKDITDENQTVTFVDPVIGTTLADTIIDGHDSYVSRNTTLADKVEYSNLIPGYSYTVKGYLVDKETGLPIVIGDTPLYAETTFVAESTDGFVDVEFDFDSTELAGKSVVCFEYLYFEDNLIAEHTDINDEGQTITFAQPEIKTTAKDKKSNTNQAYTDTETIIIDTVKFTGLIVGKEYTVEGVLMDKRTNEPLTVNGQTVTASTTFVAETADGTVDVEFNFDSTELAGKSVVCFESLYFDNNLIAEHTDIDDEGQTITFAQEEIPTQVVTEPATIETTNTQDNIDTDIEKEEISDDVSGNIISTGEDTRIYAVIAVVITVICLGIIIISGREKYDE